MDHVPEDLQAKVFALLDSSTQSQILNALSNREATEKTSLFFKRKNSSVALQYLDENHIKHLNEEKYVIIDNFVKCDNEEESFERLARRDADTLFENGQLRPAQLQKVYFLQQINQFLSHQNNVRKMIKSLMNKNFAVIASVGLIWTTSNYKWMRQTLFWH